MKAAKEAKKAVEDEVRKLSIASDNAIAMQVQVKTSLKECSAELQELRLAASEVCDHLSSTVGPCTSA
jgi:fructose/tagatose bisphosphate aldolase